ncbi:MAG: DUF2785 domain-containing protein [Psychrobium sp.]|nr:DUF2785 domain-containing protein [Psychrobium sp.]
MTLSLKLIIVTMGLGLLSNTAKASQHIDAQKVSTQCFSEKWDKKALLALKDNEFQLTGNVQQDQLLASQLLNCLAHKDPNIRDSIAFEAISSWLRADAFSPKFYKKIMTTLTATLTSTVNDKYGVLLPFTILALAEVARVDRKSPFLTDIERVNLVALASEHFVNINDYRGFDNQVGWRHAVAHGGDLFLQLALNTAIDKKSLNLMLDAIATQIVPSRNHHYVFGEPKRLVMPVTYIYLRGLHTTQEWQQWVNKISNAAPLSSWQQAYESEQGLAKLFNTKNFLFSFYATIKPSDNTALKKLVPALEEAMKFVQ